MSDTQKTIDLSYAKNALFVRHSVAIFFGIPFNHELTLDFLQDRLCGSTDVTISGCVLIRGLPSTVGELGDESRMLFSFLRALEAAHNVEVRIALHG